MEPAEGVPPAGDGAVLLYNKRLSSLPEVPATATSLVASFNALKGNPFIPASPLSSSFPSLRRLDLSHNAITHLPRLVDLAPQLEALLVGSNRLVDLECVRDLQRLRELWCPENRLAALAPVSTALGTCPSLRVVVAHSNPCVALANMTALALAAKDAAATGKGGVRDREREKDKGKGASVESAGLLLLPSPTPAELLFARDCQDLRGLVLSSPQEAIAAAALARRKAAPAVGMGPTPHSSAVVPLSAPHHGPSRVSAAALVGAVAISDGSGMTGATASAAVLRVTPDTVARARSYYASPAGQAFLVAVAAREAEHAAAAEEAVKAKARTVGGDVGAAHEGPGAAGVDGGAEAAPRRPRIPLADVRHRVPSRFVGGRPPRAASASAVERSVDRTEGNGTRSGDEEENGDGTAAADRASNSAPPTPPRGEEEGKEGGGGDNPDSPSAAARNALAQLRTRKEGILAALANLPDFSATGSGGLGSTRVGGGEGDGGVGGGGEDAPAGLSATMGSTAPSLSSTRRRLVLSDTSMRPGVQRGKIKGADPDVSRLLASAGGLGTGAKAAAENAKVPRAVTTCDIFRVDVEDGSLSSFPYASGEGLLIMADGQVRPWDVAAAAGEGGAGASTSASTLVSVRVKPDGTLIARWPNGALALEVAADERTTRGLCKWRGVGAGSGGGGGEERALAVTAYAREGTGKTRSLSVSWDGLGAGTVSAPGGSGTTFAVTSEGGGGYHGDGKSTTGGGGMARTWDVRGAITYTANTFGVTALPSPQSAAAASEESAAAEAPSAAAADSTAAGTAPKPAEESAAVDPTIRAARGAVAAAMAAAEATNAAISAIMRSRALLTAQGLAGPVRDDFGKDPRAAKTSDEDAVRRTLLRLLFPGDPNLPTAGKALPKALRSLPAFSSALGAGFPLGQHLGAALLLGGGAATATDGGGGGGTEDGGVALVVVLVCGEVRLAVRMRCAPVKARVMPVIEGGGGAGAGSATAEAAGAEEGTA
jgi:hypothetical protein